MVRTILFVALGGLALAFAGRWVAEWRQGRAQGLPTVLDVFVGFATNFFDTLGIGSFAPTTSAFKLWKMVPDERVPGTLHVGHTPPVIVQAFIFIAIVRVSMLTLVSMIVASVIGAWFGAGIVARWPRRRIQIGMGIALLIAAASFVLANLGLFPLGGDALALGPGALVLAAGVNLVLGALMTLGIGIYAPSMILVSLLGMNPVTAFPIMMGSSAFLMPVAAWRFLSAAAYRHRTALGLSLGGVPAVLIAAFIVKSLELTTLRWLVVVVVTYAAAAMLRSAHLERERSRPMAPGAEP